jgi:hypothetical protein
MPDPTGPMVVQTSADGTASYIRATSGQGWVTIAGPFATAAEANKWLLTPAKQ